jgi:hypothetical protein
MNKATPTTQTTPLSDAKRALLERMTQGAPAAEAARRIPVRPKDAPRVLSFFQESMWFGEQFVTSEDASNNLLGCTAVHGALDLKAFEAAVRGLTARHATLRTSVDAKVPRMLVAGADMPLPFAVVDLSRLGPGEGVAEALRQSRAAGARRLPTDQAPLWSCTLYRVAPQQHVLTIITHHLVADGWSFGVMLTEISAHYDALIQGREPKLPRLEIDYADYAYWQRNRRDWERNLKYWLEALSGPLPALRLPSARRSRDAWQVDTLTFCMTKELSEGVRLFARRFETSIFVTLLATFQAFLHRLSGQNDLLVGSPSAGRESETEMLVGVFINVIVLRTQLNPEQELTFLDFIEYSKATSLAAIEHGDLPTEKILEALPSKPQFYGASFYQILFDIFNFPMPREQGPLTFRTLFMDGGTAPFELSMFIDDSTKKEMVVTLNYRSDLYSRETTESWARGWLALLETAIETPKTRMAELPMTSDTPLRAHVSDDARPANR